MSSAVMTTYGRLPVTFTRGEGAWLWDSNGKKYLDALSGIAVCGLGHAHPEVAAALCEQAGQLMHTSNLYGIEHQEALAAHLTGLSGMESVFFANSGAEANEAAIKLARLYGHSKGLDNPVIIVAENSFHGRTLATLSATGNRKVQAGFEPLVTGFARVPYDDIDSIRQVISNNHNVVAIMVEPVQGEGGVNVPADDYLNQVRALCDEHALLMMLDEIQTGIGRTGKPFAFQHNGIKPDVMTLAKGLGNGMPIGACVAAGPAAALFQPGNHGSTFGGNPLACRTALTVMEILKRDSLSERAAELGQRLLQGFEQRLGENPALVSLRGKGLMIGIGLDRPCAELVGLALEQGLLINVTADSVVRLLPPLILSDEEADQIIDQVSGLIENFVAAE